MESYFKLHLYRKVTSCETSFNFIWWNQIKHKVFSQPAQQCSLHYFCVARAELFFKLMCFSDEWNSITSRQDTVSFISVNSILFNFTLHFHQTCLVFLYLGGHQCANLKKSILTAQLSFRREIETEKTFIPSIVILLTSFQF